MGFDTQKSCMQTEVWKLYSHHELKNNFKP